jgi:hypothetical protein
MERRLYPRKKFKEPVKYNDAAPGKRVETVDGEIINISDGGACVLTDKPYDKDYFVWLRLPTHPRLSKVRWVGESEGRYKLGVEFLM